MMGMGPYRFESFSENDYVKLVKNPDYHGEARAFDEIVFKVMTLDRQMQAFRDGDVDFISLQPHQYKKLVLEGDAKGDIVKNHAVYPQMVYRYIGWNGDGPFFGTEGQSAEDARRVRRAMTHAFDREHIIEEHFYGLGQITTGNFYPLSPEYDTSIQPHAFDLDKARKLLDKAGWIDADGDGIRDKDGRAFRFTLLVYNYRPEFIAMAAFHKENLAKIGVEVVVSPVDWPTMQTKMMSKEYDAYTGGWALGWESDPYQIWHSSQADIPGGSNRVGFRNARADEIIEEARVNFDLGKRVKLFHEFHQLIHEEQPYTFLFIQKGVAVWQPRIKNVIFQKIRPHDISFPWYAD